MIGNDIVDLQAAAAQSNWRRPGYLQKIFDREEQTQIYQSANPDLLVWTIWSMKEAAYKARQRECGLTRNFYPGRFKCKILKQETSSASGKVTIEEREYFTKTLYKNCCIHTTASTSAGTGIFSEIYPSSANIKEILLERISSWKDLPQSLFSIEKDENFIPVIFFNKEVQGWAFSISHHGKFSAFSLPLMKD
ncbi:4-phosphopantetheinyl transferase family protein [Antarcticibacterium flavum]|uniref:4-phosphopantetheinyl transferase family protein n=1 Tax=Antarcticibacterium flavum TaxID=2058175 RepID=A0A5B7WY50_9FLAO|nr:MULTISPECIES: 4'-phosphopantetheinyl transferase superfamily protein [Antarcticibacterium]MCM4158879.1 hypothetical protein [Antarcticibacterium sp. W02-3]QCY68134.1 4-phosphopantetheinyl transferase family protein [Antarcticibacterium flavum]